MAVREIGQGQARRQQWLTGVIVGGLSLTAFAIVLAYWIGAHRARKTVQAPPSPDAGVNQQLSGYTFTRSDQGRPVFTIHAARTVTYQGGNSTMLEDVRVETYGRKGDTGDILRTDQCQYNPQSGDFLAAGPVQIAISANSNEASGPGLRGKHRVDIETSKVAYRQNSKIAETDRPVKFRIGTASGTAEGMTYAVSDGWLELKHDVAVDLTQGTEKSPGQPIHLTASALRYDKQAGTIALSGPVEVNQGTNRAIADHTQIQLGNDHRLSRVVIEGNAKFFEATPLRNVEVAGERVEGEFDEGSGELRHLTVDKAVQGVSKSKGSVSHLDADRVDLDFTGKQPKPIQGVARGNVRVEAETSPVVSLSGKEPIQGVAGGNGRVEAETSPVMSPSGNPDPSKLTESKTLTTSELHVTFRPETRGLKDAETVGPGTLTIAPTSPKSGNKVIKAGQFVMQFDPHSRLESLHGTAPTQVLAYPAPSQTPAAGPSESLADVLDAAFDPATQTLREMKQTGNFQYSDGNRKARADEAHFDSQTQIMVLLGHPEVWDSDGRVKAQKITIDTRTNGAWGEGKVQGYHQQTAAKGPDTSNLPLPTNVLADRMVANKQSQTIHYEGNVRAWNGTDVLKAPSLDVYRKERRITSVSRVMTSFLQTYHPTGEGQGAGHPAAEVHPVTVQADSLDYLDEGRRARYHGNVHMTTEDISMQSDRLDVYLTQAETATGSQVDHAEADGHVRVTEPGRLGTGEHGDYFAGAGKMVLTGGPPVLVDEKKGSTTGQRLTFFVHDDRLFVDGGTQSPSLTQHRVAP